MRSYQGPTVCSAQSREGLKGGFAGAYSSSQRRWRSNTKLCTPVAVTGVEGTVWSSIGVGQVGYYEKFLPQKVIRHCNGLPRAVITAPGCLSSRNVQTTLSDTAFEFWEVS